MSTRCWRESISTRSVERTQIGSLIAHTGAGMASRVLDVARSQGVGLDFVVQRWANRLLRRDGTPRPGGPPLLVAEPELVEPEVVEP